MNTKRTDEDVLGSILEPTNLDEEIESVLAMTPEQRRAELEKHGVDVKGEVHAKADVFLEQAKADAAKANDAEPPKPATGNGKDGTLADEQRRRPRPLRRRPMAAFIAAGVTAAAAGGVIVAQMGPSVVGAPPNAADIRREGLDACSARSWQRCLEKLDSARDLDPEGDRAPDVQQARGAADEALHPKAPPAPK